MSLFVMVDLGLGLALFYLLLSLVCSAVTELLSALLALRSATLRKGLGNLFEGTDLLGRFYGTALVRSLHRGKRLPAAIRPEHFSEALLGLLGGPGGAAEPGALARGIGRLEEGSLAKDLLGGLLAGAREDLDRFRASLESWYDALMERISGWYKRSTQIITLVTALILVAASNADTIRLARQLSQDPGLRSSIAAAAMETAKQPAPATVPEAASAQAAAAAGATSQAADAAVVPDPAEKARALEARLESLGLFGLSLGWTELPQSLGDWLLKIVGLLITAAALTLGAPFWFDLLKNIAGMRSGLNKAATTQSTALRS